MKNQKRLLSRKVAFPPKMLDDRVLAVGRKVESKRGIKVKREGVHFN
jgi:hypothetical protein